MNGRTSRLNTLLRVRRIQEEVGRARLAAEAAAERRAQQVLEQAHELYAAPEAKPPLAHETAPVFLSGRRHRGALAGSVHFAGAGVDAAAQVTALARHDWSEAAMRMAALERLEDRASEVERTERLATEQRTSEESSSAQHLGGPTSRTMGERP
jgi:hypothetical protein